MDALCDRGDASGRGPVIISLGKRGLSLGTGDTKGVTTTICIKGGRCVRVGNKIGSGLLVRTAGASAHNSGNVFLRKGSRLGVGKGIRVSGMIAGKSTTTNVTFRKGSDRTMVSKALGVASMCKGEKHNTKVGTSKVTIANRGSGVAMAKPISVDNMGKDNLGAIKTSAAVSINNNAVRTTRSTSGSRGCCTTHIRGKAVGVGVSNGRTKGGGAGVANSVFMAKRCNGGIVRCDNKRLIS